MLADADTDGIGGTGKSDLGDRDTDGVGGTGLWGGAGDVALFGVVTGTEPLTINGHGMLVDAQTVLSLNGQPSDQAALQVGKVAWVKAGIRDNAIFANEIALESSVQGPITGYDRTLGLVRVLGQDIIISTQTSMMNASSKQATMADIQVGDWIEVAGIRSGPKTIAASLVTFKPNETVAFVRGFVNKQGTQNYQIGDQLLGDFVEATEKPTDTRLFVMGALKGADESWQSIEITARTPSPSLPFLGEVSYYSVQGYFLPNNFLAVNENQSTRFASLPQALTFTPQLSQHSQSISTSEPVILDFKPDVAQKRLEVFKITLPKQLQPQPMLIPQYSPDLPSGEFNGVDGLQPGAGDPAEAILIRKQTGTPIDRKTVLPGRAPNPRIVRPAARVHVPARAPRVRPVPPSDIVRPQLPDAQMPRTDILPGSKGPR